MGYGPTDGRTDTPPYRDKRTHLNREKKSFFFNAIVCTYLELKKKLEEEEVMEEEEREVEEEE